MNELITTHNLTKNYGKQKAVDNVSLTLTKGEIYGLVGKNGAGKTTLFKLLMGISYPTQGSVSIMGSKNESEIISHRGRIGFMMDSKFFPYLTAFQNIEYFRKLKGIVNPAETTRVLKIVELNDLKKTYKQFSMGMKQRLGLANALLGNPDIVILDEPVNGLDPQGIVDFRKMILKMNKEEGTTFLISSHILSELALLGDRFGIIHQGKLIEEITQEQLHLKSQTGILLSTDNPSKTVTLLEDKLNITNYKVNSNEDIIINDENIDTIKLSKEVVNAGIGLKKLTSIETTLEDYFISLTGGTK